MTPLPRLSVAACLLAGVLVGQLPTARSAERVPSERSRAMVVPAPAWKVARFPAAQVARLQYKEMSAARILKLKNHNAGRGMKPLQIGIARKVSGEGLTSALPALQWIASADGGSVARIEILSPVALGLAGRAEGRRSGSARGIALRRLGRA